MYEVYQRFTFFLGNFKTDFCASPFSFIIRKHIYGAGGSAFKNSWLKIIVLDKPNDFFTGYRFNYFQGATVYVFEMIVELIIQIFCASFNFFRPPSADIVDGIKYDNRAFIYYKGPGKIFDFP